MKEQKSKKFTIKMQKKLVVLYLFVLLAFAGLSVRLIWITTQNEDSYQKQVLAQQSYDSVIIPYRRGDILDAKGTVLATSEKVYNLVIDAKVMLYKEDYLEPTMTALGQCFDLDMTAIREYVLTHPTSSWYVPLKQLTYDEIKDFKAAQSADSNIKGVWFEEEYKRTTMPEALKKADEVLQQAVQGITDLINLPAIINLDFADVQTVMKDKGIAHIGIGEGKGDSKALDAVKMAVESPLLETTITGATHVIVNVSGDITLNDANDAATYVQNLAGEEVNIIFGAMYDDTMSDACTITVIATGLEDTNNNQVQSRLGAGTAYRPPTAHMTPSSLKGLDIQPTGSTVQPMPRPSVNPVPGIQRPVDIRSSVVEKGLKIPDFLQKK